MHYCDALDSPGICKHPDLDWKDLYRTNHEAIKLAISRAMGNLPSIEELIANRHNIVHEMYGPVEQMGPNGRDAGLIRAGWLGGQKQNADS
jgi:hypothetical protein